MESGKVSTDRPIDGANRSRSTAAVLALLAPPFLYGCYKLHMVGWAPADYPFTYLPIIGSVAALTAVACASPPHRRTGSALRALARWAPLGLAAYMIGFLGGYELWLSLPVANGPGIAKGSGWLLLGSATLFHLRRIGD